MNKTPEGVIHYSDRGIQYCSSEYTRILLGNGMRISMTEENHCYENAVAERINGILKDEYMPDSTFKDFYEAKKHVPKLWNCITLTASLFTGS
ncbi:MAG: integrase core domain-containing protein [Prevotellaceae bacterium]|nr:integrase core domain-containing protein [Prevotellaceae bacterium]